MDHDQVASKRPSDQDMYTVFKIGYILYSLNSMVIVKFEDYLLY